MTRTLVFLFFTQLAVGGAWTMLLVPLREAGHSFFRFNGLLAAACLALALWAGPYRVFGPAGLSALSPQLWIIALFGLCAAALLAHVWAVLSDRIPWDRRFLLTAALAGSAALVGDGLLHRSAQAPLWWETVLLPVFFLTSALFLGSVCFAMILGHWYLISPALSIRPLRRATRLILVSLTVKGILFGVALYLYATAADPARQQTVRTFLGAGGFFLWARALFGLVGPAILSLMIWSTVKIRSTQSATGLLYVATILVLIGELLSKFLLYATSVPV
ncbi:MAG: hypothetical protein EXS64_11755 [Candidatus Latescibacteria bacterium]|nr:hypothetical protein [Candidatus Latescibacterota bacterium]